MNLVPGYKKLEEMYIVLNVDFAQKLYQFLVKVWKLWSQMQKVPNFENVCQNLVVQPFHLRKTSQPVEISTLKQTNIVDVNAKQLATKAEIMWSIDVVLSNYSFNSISNKSDLFCIMLPDSKLVENFSCGNTKCSYVVCFGLAPYFLRS